MKISFIIHKLIESAILENKQIFQNKPTKIPFFSFFLKNYSYNIRL